MSISLDFAPWVSDEAIAWARAEATMPPPASDDVATLRAHYDAFNRRQLDDALANYPVDHAAQHIAGVSVHVVTPRGDFDTDRILLCLHGGAFMWGRGAGALLEAVPVAATARLRVIAVEYALAPEHVFPAAVEDVLRVYDALREQHSVAQIGIYGCSAGAALTAQAVARLIADRAPLPGAIAMLHGTALDFAGDSMDPGSLRIEALPYFAGADLDDPRVLPGRHPEMLAQFPPSLLVTGTRDFAASAVSVMHRRLLAAGADAQLIHFDGMWHAHHMATTTPESRETFAALARFFARFLR